MANKDEIKEETLQKVQGGATYVYSHFYKVPGTTAKKNYDGEAPYQLPLDEGAVPLPVPPAVSEEK